ncbi:MAG: LysR family transcriptional regulator [Acidimicrobiia bacterium]|nr:LysR family transcriptional regulator [Acidimicrobiia bacterium]
MDVRQLAYVVAVVDHGTFTAAAEACHVTQPALSQGIAALERELGVELFHRVRRGVVLTAAGEALLGPARTAAGAIRAAHDAVAAVRGVMSGTLDLVTLPTLAAAPTAELVGAFRRAHPGVAVRMAQSEDPATAAEAVASGEVEIAVTELDRAVDDLVAVEIGTQQYSAVLPPGTRRRRQIGIESLAAMPLVATPPGTSTRRHLDDACAAAGVEPEIVVETAQREALVPLVTAGAGAALLPEAQAAQAAAHGAVVARVAPVVARRVGVLHRRAALGPAAAAMVAMVRSGPGSGAALG